VTAGQPPPAVGLDTHPRGRPPRYRPAHGEHQEIKLGTATVGAPEATVVSLWMAPPWQRRTLPW